MNEDEYLDQRVNDQIDWYDKKSQMSQRIYKRLRVLEIVAAATIPLLSGFSHKVNQFTIVVGLLGLLIAVIAGIISLYRFQENWTEYRTTSESLKHEKFLYLTETDPYNKDNPFPLFVQHVESLISKEHSKWTQIMQTGSTDGKTKSTDQ